MSTDSCDVCSVNNSLTEFKCSICKDLFLYCKSCFKLVNHCKTCFDCMYSIPIKTKSKKFTDRRSS